MLLDESYERFGSIAMRKEWWFWQRKTQCYRLVIRRCPRVRLDAEAMRKLDNVPGLVDLLMVTFPLMSGVSEYSTASGDCSPKSFGGEQDTVESLDDTVDLLGRYTQVMPFLRQCQMKICSDTLALWTVEEV
ncbi:unnamed protein product [Fusarium graminearum]|uniref:Chromosome 4, complete genome n=1 Tax=Gibberella zeae (strain ATCC MYA-4620 / CBS 123657 / FGSC 9075 / NRRL 31084 / PH-1) TaxID=229533 RepID=A0A098DWA9_GIBZE|nr:unnamed protein product [Fusarium graminearum]CZS73058.1 unnamed protein product [Fusarium graminearum]